MSFAQRVKNEARDTRGSLVFPEGDDDRIREVVEILVDEGYLDEAIVLGTQEKFSRPSITLHDPEQSSFRSDVKSVLESEMDEADETEIKEALGNPLFFGAALVELGVVDGMVAGADNPTANVLRAALTVVGTLPDQNVVSSSFVMELSSNKFGSDGLMVFSDPAVLPDPDATQLVDVAAGAVRTHENLIRINDPLVAFLSFSTRGSASHDSVEKVRTATGKFQEKYPKVLSDGELQADAAIVESVADRKAPDSSVAGRANVLVFPNLDAANIGYKLVQWLGGASAFGPFLQGLDGVVNDLSRGCSVNDILTVACVSLLQSRGGT